MRCAEAVAAAYMLGQRDAIDAAVQRVEALHERYLFGKREYAALIAAIKGDKP